MSEATENVIAKHRQAPGWSDQTVLDLLVEYIDNQQSDDALDDFLATKAAEDQDNSGCDSCGTHDRMVGSNVCEECGRADPERIIAHLQPQQWVGAKEDQAMEVGTGYYFEVTDQILALGEEKARALEDCSYDADNLWHDHPISTKRPHDGPFHVSVADAITDYFDVHPTG